jgi:hypothetical protein
MTIVRLKVAALGDIVAPMRHSSPVGGGQSVVGSDMLKRAAAAWWAGSEELNQVARLPAASAPVGSNGALPIGDARVERGALNVATTTLATLLGTLQTATTTARAWGAEIGLADLNLPTQVETVEAQTRRVRTLRERYEARWGTFR